MFAEPEKVPQIEAIGIDFPGYVRDIESALQLLGGAQGVAKISNSAGTPLLPLHFRPDDVTSHPIFGEKHSARGLLVKIARKAGDGPVSGQIVARISHLYRFPGVADFQFVPDTTLPTQDEGPMAEKLEGPYGTAVEPLLAIPPLFTRVDMPMEYQFRSFYGEDPPAFRGPGGAKSKGQLPPYVMKAICLGVPPAISVSELVEGSFKPEKRELLKKLHELFCERPVWSAMGLHDRLQELKISLNELEASLPRVAYTFRSGPFMWLWMLRGYDPRASPESRDLQAVSYALPQQWLEKYRAKADRDDDEEEQPDAVPLPDIATSYSELKSFKAVPKQQALLQARDIADAQVSSMLQRLHVPAAFDPVSGWFTESELKFMRDRVTERFQALLDAAGPRESDEQPGIETDAAALSADPTQNPDQPMTASEEDAAGAVDAAEEPSPGKTPAGKHSIVPEGIMDALLVDWTPGNPLPEGAQQQGLASPQPQEEAAAAVAALQDEFEIFEDESEDDPGFDGPEEDEDEDDEDDEDEDDVMEDEDDG